MQSHEGVSRPASLTSPDGALGPGWPPNVEEAAPVVSVRIRTQNPAAAAQTVLTYSAIWR